MVVSPHNPLKNESELAPFHHRLEMVKCALENYEGVRVCDEEQYLPKPSYTSQTMKHLCEKYTDVAFSIIIGEDSLVHFSKWKEEEYLLNNFTFYVYPRSISEENRTFVRSKYPQMNWLDAPIIDVSSTAIRARLAKGGSVQFLTVPVVEKYMDDNHLYR